jgi:hypothetical protein
MLPQSSHDSDKPIPNSRDDERSEEEPQNGRYELDGVHAA